MKTFTEQEINDAIDEFIENGYDGAPETVLEAFRRKLLTPPKKPVDLSVLIESGIDCEFFESGGSSLGPLGAICGDRYFSAFNHHYFAQCRPRMDHWHAWTKGPCPLPEGVKVMVRFRGGSTGEARAVEYLWRPTDDPGDIIAFKVIGLEDGYCWPWEVDA